MNFEVRRLGDSALRFSLPDGANGRAVLAALRAHPGVEDAVVTERHALVTFDPAAPPPALDETITKALTEPATRDHPAEHVVRVRYDGPDLEDVARRAALMPREVAARHSRGRYIVAAIGFLPGFAYLRGLDERLHFPRRANPRARVEPFSVALAGPYTGVYPFASPGGWHLIGTAVGFALFDAQAGARFVLGDHVTFLEAAP
jgi:5-oxoprolinase (ATP-hydrolysing) subunit A